MAASKGEEVEYDDGEHEIVLDTALEDAEPLTVIFRKNLRAFMTLARGYDGKIKMQNEIANSDGIHESVARCCS